MAVKIVECELIGAQCPEYPRLSKDFGIHAHFVKSDEN